MKHKWEPNGGLNLHWPGEVICVICKKTADSECDPLDADGIVKWRMKINLMKCPGKLHIKAP